MSSNAETVEGSLEQRSAKECLSCRIIGTASLGAVGLYALNQSRPHQPGSLLGKRILAGVGICECSTYIWIISSVEGLLGFLVGSAFRWTNWYVTLTDLAFIYSKYKDIDILGML